jgi:hypothetical protein
MPFNLLLIPLVAGYLFLIQAHLFAYSTSLLEKEQLLLRVSMVGLALAIASRLLCCALATLSFGIQLKAALYQLAPFPYIGTALGTIPISVAAYQITNFLVPQNIAGDWLYHSNRLNQLESLLMRSVMGVAPREEISKKKLLWIQTKRLISPLLRTPNWGKAIRRVRRQSIFPSAQLLPVMLSMSDNKVYVGYVNELPPIEGNGLQYVRVVPIWSGYRTPDTKEVVRVTSYVDALKRVNDYSALIKIVRCEDISTAGLFEDDLFDIQEKKSRRRPTSTKRRIVRPRKTKSR